MRFLTAIAALAALVTAVSCEGGSGATVPPGCAGLRRPGVPLALAPAKAPTLARARCLGTRYAAVIGRLGWGTLPKVMRTTNPGMAAWQERSLLYACNACGVAGFGLDWVRAHHPGWIMHARSGDEIHPQQHPSWVLLNFTSPKYEYAWAVHVGHSLAAGGWTGVDVIDAANDPDWSEPPVDPSSATRQLMTERQKRAYLAAALRLVRDTLLLQGYSLLAENGPPSTFDFDQVNSTDAVLLDRGFADLSGTAWGTELDYYRQVDEARSGAYVWDRRRLSQAQQVYGLAAFLLIQIPRDSAYIAPAPPDSPLYAINPGTPPDALATQQGPVWLRTYPDAVVAVNPSQVAAKVTLGAAGPVEIGPESAVIETDGHLLSSG